jgi:hypothetical protein
MVFASIRRAAVPLCTVLVTAACLNACSGSSGGPGVPRNNQPASSNHAQKAAIPQIVHVNARYSRVHPLELSNGPPEGNTNDYCTTVPTGWECVIQGGTNTDGAFYWPGPAGATVVWTGAPTTDGVTFTPATYTTSTAPYTYSYTEAASTTAGLGNKFSAPVSANISGSASYCQTNYCGTANGTTYFQVSCALSLGHCPAVQIYDGDLEVPVSGSPPPTTKTYIGEQQNPTVQWKTGTGSATSYTISSSPAPAWVIAGNPVTAYPLGQATAPATSPTTTPVQASDLNKLTPTPFFWLLPATNTASVSATLTGTLGSAGTETSLASTSASYKVQAPTRISIGTSSVASPYSSYTATQVFDQLGTYPAPPPGIVYSFNAAVPSGGAGSFAALQLVKTCVSFINGGTTYYLNLNSSALALDTEELYGNVVTPTSQAWTSNDNPGTSLNYSAGTSRLSDVSSYQTYMLYKPTGAGAGANNGIWVPLGYLTWAWSGVTTQNPLGTWTPATGSKPAPVGTASPGTPLPTWTRVFNKSVPGTTTKNNC